MAGEILSAGDLADLRAVAVEFFPDVCNVIAGVITDDGFGGQMESWETPTTIASAEPCYFTETLNDDEQAMVNRRGLAVVAAIHLTGLVPVAEGQRITLTAAYGDHSGTYSVQGIARDSDEAQRIALVGKVG
jgi:hypothetical protein